MKRRRLGFPALDRVGKVYGISRVGILEWIPVIGSVFFRRRVEAAIAFGMGARDVRLYAAMPGDQPDDPTVVYWH
jgi:hypothetical protein